MYADLDDPALLQRCRLGEQGAWSTLVRRYQRLVYTVPRSMGLPEEQASDVFQVTFSRLLSSVNKLDDPSRVRAWLVTTAKRESLRLLSENRRFASALESASSSAETSDSATGPDPMAELVDPSPLQDEQLSALQQHDRLRAAVDRLDPAARQFIELVFLQDEPLPYAEIARRLQMPEGSIGPTRARCLTKLRALLARS